jgi:hypothetical protein
MMLSIPELKFKRASNRRWHRRWVFLRFINIGGYGTSERETRVFVIAARLWARRSQSLRRWIFTEN